MSKKDKKQKPSKEEEKKGSVKVSDELKDFDIHINTFGEIISNYDVDKINEFLNKNVVDKKLKNRNDILKSDEESEKEDQSE
ncbi:MAG: hypothetical protein NW226_20575 [Microscillaceae bacterium]|nr:hypothetical protein [Microscillaceae bacterium]